MIHYLEAAVLTHILDLAHDLADETFFYKLGGEHRVKRDCDTAVEHRAVFFLLLCFDQQVVLGELPAGEDGEAVLGDFIESDEPTPDVLCELEDRNKLLIKAVNTVLTPKEKNIIEKRFGLNGSKRMTLLELGESIGLTNERVRQIELGALRKLRRHLEVRSLNDGNAA